MRQHWTLEKSRALAVRMERQLEHTIAASLALDPLGGTLDRMYGAAAHEAVVNLITLYRDHVAGTTAVATLIAKAYAKCIDSSVETTTSACIQRVLNTARTAREQHLPVEDTSR
jgi:hypothetical protein